jgi:Photosystem II Psb31 protein
MDRRVAFGQIAAAGAVLAGVPAIASADGAVSTASITKAKVVYGSRIAALKPAVEKGDFAALVAEKNAFILFNSGAYPTAKQKPAKKAAIEQVNAIFSAVRKGDKAAVKAAYDKYVAANEIKDVLSASASGGQTYSSDFGYVVKTKAASVYVR